jgi:diacylglycerol kinase (ATP)
MRSDLRFLVNPSAGGGRARRVLERVRERAAARSARVELSEDGGDLTVRARRAVEEGTRRLVVVGGDGTVHLAIQALAGSGCELAVVPAGRGDDFAVSLSVPTGVDEALELAVAGESRELDLIRVVRADGDSFWGDIYVSFGFDSAVTRTGNAQPRWIPRDLTYIFAALRTLIGFRASRFTVEHDGGAWEGRAMLVTACNAPIYGGGMRIAPEASMDDGLMDIVAVKRVSKLELLRVFPKVFGGDHVGHPAVSIFRSSKARISVEPSVLIGSDGEIEGESGSEAVELAVVPKALRAVVQARADVEDPSGGDGSPGRVG